MRKFYMRKFKRYEPMQSIMLPFEGKLQFPEGTFENFLVKTIRKLSVDDFYSTEPQQGEKPFNPKSLLGVIFYGIATGNFSSRKMERGCKVDLGFMYISGFATPDHATICRFIEKFLLQIKEIFSQILYIADSCNYIDYNILAADGTKIKASASTTFTGTLEEFRTKKKRLKRKISEALDKLNKTDSTEDKETLKKRANRLQKEADKITGFLEEAQERTTKKGKESRQNIVDNDSRIMKMKKGYGEAYNAQAASDSKNGIIVAATVSMEASDTKNLKLIMDEIEETCDQEKLEDTKYVFDNGYYCTENVLEVEKDDKDVYISPKTDKKYYLDEEEDCNGKVTAKNCVIEKSGDNVTFTCPGKRIFSNAKIISKKEQENDYYKVIVDSFEKCHACKYFSDCIGEKKQKSFSMGKTKVDNIKILENFINKMQSEDGKKIYSKRMPTIERVFGCIKRVFGFWETERRGKKQINTEWFLICSTYNLKRMFSLSCQS